MSIFENIAPWAQQQQQGQQQPSMFNPAPQIMSQYNGSMGGVGGQRQAPQLPMPGGATSQPQGAMSGLQGLMGSDPNSSNNPMAAGMGSPGLLQLLAAMQNGRQAPSGTGLPSMIDNQMPGAAAGGGGGIFDFIKRLFG
jgi:hypothetical protein